MRAVSLFGLLAMAILCFPSLHAKGFLSELGDALKSTEYFSRLNIANRSDYKLHVFSHQSDNKHRKIKGMGDVSPHSSRQIEIATDGPDTVQVQVNYDLNGQAGRIIIAEWIHQHKQSLQSRRYDNPNLRVDFDNVHKTLNVRNKMMYT